MILKIVRTIAFLCVLPMSAMERPTNVGHQELLKAIWAQDLNAVAALLRPTNINYFTDLNRSDFALRVAVQSVNPAMVQLLLQSGADPGLDEDILCAAQRAVSPFSLEDPFVFRKRRSEVMKILLKDPRTNVNCRDLDGTVPLIKAFNAGEDDLVSEIIKTGRVDPADMRIALRRAKGRKPQIQTLLEQQLAAAERKKSKVTTPQPQPIPAAAQTPTQVPLPPVLQIIKSGDLVAMHNLLIGGLNPNETIEAIIRGKSLTTTLLRWAIYFGQLLIVDLLLKHKLLNPNIASQNGSTALMKAVEIGNQAIIKRMLQDPRVIHGVNIENAEKLTALDFANANLKKGVPNSAEIINMLFQKGAHIGSSETRQPLLAKAGRPNVPAQSYAFLGVSTDATAPEILGIESGASKEDIQKAYRKLAQTWHPDKNKGEFAKETFALIQWAYETLKQ